jgi:hypothetical protein
MIDSVSRTLLAPLRKKFLPMLAALLLLAGCQQAVVPDTGAADRMPNLPGYTVTDTSQLQGTLANLLTAASATGGALPVAGAIQGINAVAQCYQQAGALQGRIYTNTSNPLDIGAVLIINRNVLTSPATFLSCVVPSMGGAGAMPGPYQPCAAAFSVPVDGNEFYVAYVASNTNLCAAFCANIAGCNQ